MKKVLSLVLALALLCGCMLTLASCFGGGLSGKYTNDTAGVSYEFKGKEFTRTAKIPFTESVVTSSGTYEITEEGEKTYITFTYTSGDEEAKEDAGVKMELTKGEENGTSYIKFGSGLGKLVKYVKE